MNILTTIWTAIKRAIGGGMGVLRCDTSFNQGRVNWKRAKEDGVVHAGIRWGQRDGRNGYTDPRAKENWENAQQEQIDRYGYWCGTSEPVMMP